MNARVLIVEENEMNRGLLSRYLTLQGDQTTTDAACAVESIAVDRPDLILRDVSPPDEDGCQLTRRLKSHGSTRQIPVIALTAHAIVGVREQCLAAGYDDYETKPIDFRSLMQKIDSLLLTSVVR